MELCEKHLPEKFSLSVLMPALCRSEKTKGKKKIKPQKSQNTKNTKQTNKQKSVDKTKYKHLKIEVFCKKTPLLNKYISSPKCLCSKGDFFI